MGQAPFSRRSSSINLQADRRRSTRLDLAVPIVISGRDSAGKLYREETETFSVSFHGAKFKTRQQVLIGMQLTVENLLAGEAEKAICVRVSEPEPGQDKHDMAIQFLHPRNIWGVKNPPPDWQAPGGVTTALPELPTAYVSAPPKPGAATSAPVPEPGFEQRANELAESVLELLRRQAAGVLRDSLKEFEEHLKVLEAGAEARIIQQSEKAVAVAGARTRQQTDKAVEETELSLGKMRRELMDQLAARTERTLAEMEQTLRSRIAEFFSPFLKSPATTQAETKSANEIRK